MYVIDLEKSIEHLNDKKSILNKIKENKQKIALISLRPIGYNEHIHINHLKRENKTLEGLYKKGIK